MASAKAKSRIPLSALMMTWGLPEGETEVLAVPGRKFRLDWAYRPLKVAVEQQGGIWVRGKHGRGSGILSDMHRRNILQIAGWIVLEFPPDELWGGYAVETIRAALESRGWKET